MTTQYTPILQLALPVTGELNGTWGDVVNDSITSMVEEAIAGLATISTWTANSHTLTTADGTTDEARCAMLVATSTTAASNIICPDRTKLYVLKNSSSYAVTLKTAAGTGVAVAAGDTAFLFCDGTNVGSCVTQIVNGHITGNLTVDGNTTLGDASGDTVTVNAGTTTFVNANPTLSQGTATRILFLNGSKVIADAAGLTWDGTTMSATRVAASQVNITGQGDLRLEDSTGGEYVALQAPATLSASYTLTLPIDDGVSGQALITDGSGNLSWSTSASGDVYGPASATSTAVALFDGTTGKLIKNSGVTIDGSNNVSGVAQLNATTVDLTNLEVTNIKAKDGTAAITLADSTGALTINSATANGVFYANGSKVLTTGSALTFDGSLFKVAGFADFSTSNTTCRISSNATSAYVGDNSIGNGTGFGFNSPSAYLYFQTYGSEQMRLTSTGLGIGTSSPSYKLDINGQARTKGTFWVDRSATSANAIVNWSTNGTYDWQLYTTGSATPSLSFYQSGVGDRLTLDSSGNLGLGVTPSAWGSNYKALDLFGGSFAAATGGVSSEVLANAYNNGTNFIYKYSSNAAARYQQNSAGAHTWFTAPSGTAGNAISFTQAMTLDASGNLLVGRTSGAYRIDAAHSSAGEIARFSYTGGSKNPYIAAIAQSDAVMFLDAQNSDNTVALGIRVSGSERMRIDSSGNVGFGRSSPTYKLDVGGIVCSRIATNAGDTFLSTDGSVNIGLGISGGDGYISSFGGATKFIVNAAERMRIDSSGNLLVGTTSRFDSCKLGVMCGLNTNNALVIQNTDSFGGNFAVFDNSSGVNAGKIVHNGSTTVQYATSSDYRLKENIQPMQNALDVVAQLNPVRYTWKADGSDGQGFIAHELQAVVPDCVTGEKDAVDAEGKPVYQGIDTSFLVATLTKAIQEQQQLIEALTARVAQLEGN